MRYLLSRLVLAVMMNLTLPNHLPAQECAPVYMCNNDEHPETNASWCCPEPEPEPPPITDDDDPAYDLIRDIFAEMLRQGGWPKGHNMAEPLPEYHSKGD